MVPRLDRAARAMGKTPQAARVSARSWCAASLLQSGPVIGRSTDRPAGARGCVVAKSAAVHGRQRPRAHREPAAATGAAAACPSILAWVLPTAQKNSEFFQGFPAEWRSAIGIQYCAGN